VSPVKELLTPPDIGELRSLAAGDDIVLTGQVLTMRDAALGRLDSLLAEGGRPPFELAGQVVFHAGPTPPAAGRPTGAIGPTTAARMDHFLEMLFDQGVVATIGKGPRSAESTAVHESNGAVYFAAIGGIAALYGGMVVAMEPVAWDDLGPEAVRRVTILRFPVLVAIDSSGADFLASRHARYRRD